MSILAVGKRLLEMELQPIGTGTKAKQTLVWQRRKSQPQISSMAEPYKKSEAQEYQKQKKPRFEK